MAKCIPYGSDASSGTYKCVDCGHEMSRQSSTSLPPCPERNKKPHSKNCWYALTGQGDNPRDPYPNR